MITICHYRNLYSCTGRHVQQVEFVPGMNVEEALGGLPPGRMVLRNGSRASLGDSLRDGDCLQIAADIQGVEIASFLVTAIVTAAISTGIGFLLNLILAPGSPQIRRSRKEESKALTFGAITNTVEDNAPIPVVYGERRTGGILIGQVSRFDTEGRERLYMLLLLSHGPVSAIGNQTADFDGIAASDLLGLEIDGNPATNFGGVTCSGRLGTPLQATVPGFQEIAVESPVDAELSVAAGTISFTTNDQVEALEVNVLFPNGLYRLSGSGDIKTITCEYRARYRVHDTGGGVPGSWSAWTNVKVSKGERSQFGSTLRFDRLDLAQYDLEVERVTADPDPDDLKTQNATRVRSVNEIQYNDQRYPSMALLAIEAVPTDQTNGRRPVVSITVQGRTPRVPKTGTVSVNLGASAVTGVETLFTTELAVGASINLGGEDHKIATITDDTHFSLVSPHQTGVSGGTLYRHEYSRNPAWCALDWLTDDQYGLGALIDDRLIDLDAFRDWAAHCDQLVSDGTSGGGVQVRCRTDGVIDHQQSAWDWAQEISASGEAVLVQVGDKIKPLIDRDEPAVQLFTDGGNIEEDSLSIRYLNTSSEPNKFIAQFWDETSNWDEKRVGSINQAAVRDGRSEIIQEFALPMVTRQAQAKRMATRRANQAQAQTKTIEVTASLDAVACQVGDVVRVAVNLPQWGFSGRLSGASVQHVELDRAVVLDAASEYGVLIQYRPDDVVQRRVQPGLAGEFPPGTPIPLESPLPSEPRARAVYSFSLNALESKPFRVVEIDLGQDLKRKVRAVEHNVLAYQDTEELIDSPDYSQLPGPSTIPNDVRDLVAEERYIEQPDHTVQLVVDLLWRPPSVGSEFVKDYLVWYRVLGETGWRQIDRPAVTNRMTIADLLDTNTAYQFTVTPRSLNGNRKSPDQTPLVTSRLGFAKERPPVVTGLTLSLIANNQYSVAWDAQDDPEVSGYVLYGFGDNAEDGLWIADVTDAAYPLVYLFPGSNSKVRVYAKNLAGRKSENAALASVASPDNALGTLINTTTLSPTFPGTLTGCSVVSGKIEQTTWSTPATYETNAIDLGLLADHDIYVYCQADFQVAPRPKLQDMHFQIASLESDSWRTTSSGSPHGADGQGIVQPLDRASAFLDLKMEIATSADNVTYGPYSQHSPMTRFEANCRYIKLRVTLTSGSPFYRYRVQDLIIKAYR